MIMRFSDYHVLKYKKDTKSLVSDIYVSFRDKWGVKYSRNIWVDYWFSILSESGYSLETIRYVLNLCIENETEAPTLFYFIHLCALFNNRGLCKCY